MASFDESNNINEFVQQIITKDMGPDALEQHKLRFGQCVKTKLPVDTASRPNHCIFFSQMIRTCGDIGEGVLNELGASYNADSQDGAIFVSSSASGTGKTHSAYAVGKYVYTIINRVAEAESIVGPELSAPWRHLVTTINGIVAHYKQLHCVEDAADLSLENCRQCARSAFLCIKLLICCYVSVSLDVIAMASHFSVAQKRELLLRFHRNHPSEKIVCARFTMELAKHCGGVSHCSLLSGESVDQYCKDLVTRVGLTGERIFICFDEINALYNFFPSLFFHKDSCDDNGDMDHCGDTSIRRGLFYAVATCMVSLSKSTNWAMHMTGTAFSLTQFICSGSDLSPVRGCVVNVSPSKYLDVDDMRTLLEHYFSICEGAFTDERVVEMLKYCSGRPHIFIVVVFRRIYTILYQKEVKPDVLDVEILLENWKRVASTMQNTYEGLFRNLLMKTPKHLPHDSDGSTKSLIPILLTALMLGDGILHLPDDDVVAEAIRCSIVPVTSYAKQKAVDLEKEPLVKEALLNVLLQLIEKRMEMVMRLILSGIGCKDKGSTAEIAFATYLALSSSFNLRQGNNNSLSVLLDPFFENSGDQPSHLMELTCRVSLVVDMSKWASDKCFLRRFVKDDGSYDTSILLINIPAVAGVDVAFLAINEYVPADMPGHIRLVVFQLRNRRHGLLKNALLTLHPGTQYMSNDQRECALTFSRRDNLSVEAVESQASNFPMSFSGGVGSSVWTDYHAFASLHPMLCENWIRNAVFAQGIHDKVLSFMYDFSNRICDLHRCEDGDELKRLKVAAERSPVVVLTMNSSRWLTTSFRNDFIDISDTKLYQPMSQDAIPYFDVLSVGEVNRVLVKHIDNAIQEH